MIKSNELREGNLLLSVLTKEYVRVGWLQIKHVSDGNIQSAYDTTPVYEPIPLSPEILEKAGFRKDVLGYSNDSYFSIYYNHKRNEGVYGAFWKDFAAGVDFQYLHQLQNLYYALTGEELTVNL